MTHIQFENCCRDFNHVHRQVSLQQLASSIAASTMQRRGGGSLTPLPASSWNCAGLPGDRSCNNRSTGSRGSSAACTSGPPLPPGCPPESAAGATIGITMTGEMIGHQVTGHPPPPTHTLRPPPHLCILTSTFQKPHRRFSRWRLRVCSMLWTSQPKTHPVSTSSFRVLGCWRV